MKKIILILTLLVSLKSFAATIQDYYQAEVQTYQKGLYDQAVQYGRYVVQNDPQNWQAYQVLCSAYYKLGNNAKAQEASGQSLKIHPDNPGLQKFDQYLQTTLNPGPPAVPGADTAPKTKPSTDFLSLRVFTLRAETSFPDLQENAETLSKEAAQAQLSDTSTSFRATVPTASGEVVAEPDLWLDKEWQVGIPLSFYDITAATVTQSSNSQGTVGASFSPTVFSVGLNGRYMLRAGGFQFDASAGPLLAFMGLDYAGQSGTSTFSGNFSATAFGFQAELGASMEFFDLFTIGPTASYQMASASGFRGTVGGTGIPSVTGTWEMVPGPQGNGLTILPDGTSAPSGSRPFTMDISGLRYGAQMTVFF